MDGLGQNFSGKIKAASLLDWNCRLFQRNAASSVEWNLKHGAFKRMFPELDGGLDAIAETKPPDADGDEKNTPPTETLRGLGLD